MDVTSVVAIIIAFTSLSFGVVQWLTRHRPYIGVVNLDWETVHGEYRGSGDRILPDTIKCTIKNVGEAPAKGIVIDGTVESVGYANKSDKKEITSLGLGILFPGQEVEVLLPFNMDSREVGIQFADGEGVVAIDTVISYQSILFLKWQKKHRTQQKHIIFQAPTSWRTLSGGSFS